MTQQGTWNQTTVEIDGLVFDTDTGEFLSVAKHPEFHVTDQDSAEWVLEKASKLDADIIAIEARMRAVAENLGRMATEKRRQREGLMRRFGAEIEKFASENLPKGKKTWTCAYGSVAFRQTPARINIEDPRTALWWCSIHAKGAIKVEESVMKSAIPSELVASFIDDPEFAMSNGFGVVPAGESVTIKTGVSPHDQNEQTGATTT